MLSSGKLVALLMTLAMAAALSRLLDQPSYGAFSMVLTLYAIGSVIFAAGMPQSVHYFLPRLSPAEQRGLVLQTIGLLAGLGMVLSVALRLLAGPIGQAFHSHQLGELLAALGPFPAFMLPVMAADSVMIGFDRVKSIVLLNVLVKASMFLAVAVPVYLGGTLILGVRCWVVVAGAQLLLAVWLMFRSVPGGGLKLSGRLLREQVRYALPLGLASLLGAIGIYADRLIVSRFGGPAVFAIYANGAIEIPIINVINLAAMTAIMPHMIRHIKNGQPDAFLGLWHRAQTKTALILFPLLGFLLFFAAEAVVLLFGSRYAASAPIFQIYLWRIPIRIASLVLLIMPLRKNWLYAGAHLVQLAIAYPVCAWLYRAFALPGAAAGIVVVSYLTAGLIAHGVARTMRIPTWRIWPWRKLITNLAAALACGLISYLLCWKLPDASAAQKLIRLAVGGAIYCVLYVIAMSRLGLFKAAEWRGVLAPLKSRLSAGSAGGGGEPPEHRAKGDQRSGPR